MLPSHSPTQTLFWHNGKWGWSICCVCYLPLQVLGRYEFAWSVFPPAWSSPCIVCLYKKKTSSAAPRRGDTRYLGTREWGLSLSTPTAHQNHQTQNKASGLVSATAGLREKMSHSLAWIRKKKKKERRHQSCTSAEAATVAPLWLITSKHIWMHPSQTCIAMKKVKYSSPGHMHIIRWILNSKETRPQACICVIIYRQSPGGWSDGFNLGSMGGWIQAVGSLFGHAGVADLGEISGRYRVHLRTGQSSEEEVGLHSTGGQKLHLLLRARQPHCLPTRCRRDAFRHPHHFPE